MPLLRMSRHSSGGVGGPGPVPQAPPEVGEPGMLQVVPVNRFPQSRADVELEEQEDAPVARPLVEAARQARLELGRALLVGRALRLGRRT